MIFIKVNSISIDLYSELMKVDTGDTIIPLDNPKSDIIMSIKGQRSKIRLGKNLSHI